MSGPTHVIRGDPPGRDDENIFLAPLKFLASSMEFLMKVRSSYNYSGSVLFLADYHEKESTKTGWPDTVSPLRIWKRFHNEGAIGQQQNRSGRDKNRRGLPPRSGGGGVRGSNARVNSFRSPTPPPPCSHVEGGGVPLDNRQNLCCPFWAGLWVMPSEGQFDIAKREINSAESNFL